jgi:hypothetical protein
MVILKWMGLTAPFLILAGCGQSSNSTPIDGAMGDKVKVGPLVYSVIDASWKGELGEGYKIRTPSQRFLLLTVSITNSGGNDVSVPMLQLEGNNGQSYQELANGDGVDQYIGILRNISPSQTLQGRMLFDVPLTSFRLRLVDGGEPGFEKYGFVQIPLNLNAESPVLSPLPGTGFK